MMSLFPSCQGQTHDSDSYAEVIAAVAESQRWVDCLACLTSQRCGAVVPLGRVYSKSSTWPLSLLTSPGSPGMRLLCAHTNTSPAMNKDTYIIKVQFMFYCRWLWCFVFTCNSHHHQWLCQIQSAPHQECRRQS